MTAEFGYDDGKDGLLLEKCVVSNMTSWADQMCITRSLGHRLYRRSHDRSSMSRATMSRQPVAIRRKPTLSPSSSQRRNQYFSA